MAKKKKQKNKNSKLNKKDILETKDELKESKEIEEQKEIEETDITKKNITEENNKEIQENHEINNEVDKESSTVLTKEKEESQEDNQEESIKDAIKQDLPQNDVKIVERVVEKIVIKEVEPKKKNILIRIFLFFFSRIMFMIFLIVVFLLSIKIAIIVFGEKSNERIFGEVSKTFQKQVTDLDGNIIGPFIDFEELQEKNTNTVGWLKINNTKVDIPIVRGVDNSFYLKHNYYKALNSSGWVFVDFSNKLDGSDKNIVIYGKNSIDGGIFVDLKNILKNKWLNNDENKIITFITPTEITKYEVFSIYKTKYENDYTKTVFVDGEFDIFLDNIKSKSIKDFGTEVTNSDSIMTITTVDQDGKEKIVLHAKKVVEQ